MALDGAMDVFDRLLNKGGLKIAKDEYELNCPGSFSGIDY
jgi:hypothetical protein